jgi:hypothetical protein
VRPGPGNTPGIRSRRELVAALLNQNYLPRAKADERLASNRFFASGLSAALRPLPTRPLQPQSRKRA